MRRYIPDFIVLVEDGHGEDDLLHLIVEIKGYRKEDAKEKKATMETMWVPGVNHHKRYGHWAFAEFTGVYMIEPEFEARVEGEFDKMVTAGTKAGPWALLVRLQPLPQRRIHLRLPAAAARAEPLHHVGVEADGG